MRENNFTQIGQCGIQIGTGFWSTLCSEHNIGKNGKLFMNDDNDDLKELKLDKIDAYFQESAPSEAMRFTPRAVLIDSDPGMIDIIKASSMRALFKPNNYCFGTTGDGYNTWYDSVLYFLQTQ